MGWCPRVGWCGVLTCGGVVLCLVVLWGSILAWYWLRIGWSGVGVVQRDKFRSKVSVKLTYNHICMVLQYIQSKHFASLL